MNKWEEQLRAILDETSSKEAHDNVPQPAGAIAATWYEDKQPDPTEMLYTIACLLAKLDART